MYLANGKDPDEMLHHASFHQSIHCLLGQKQPSEEKQFHLEVVISDPCINTKLIILYVLHQTRRKSPLVRVKHQFIADTDSEQPQKISHNI